jgi:hypothetical protein
MTPTEIAHAVEDALGCRVDPVHFAAMRFTMTPGEIRLMMRQGLLPADLDLAGILELLQHPELEEWREIRIACLKIAQWGTDPIDDADLPAAVDAQVARSLRFRRETGCYLHPDSCLGNFWRDPVMIEFMENVLYAGLERIAKVKA